MAEMVNGRRADTDIIVSTGPDVCLTPVGSAMVPVAYTSVAFLGQSERLPGTVLDNGHPDFHLNSRVCTSTGHEPGTGAGVVVPGYRGEAFVQNASPTVFTETYATTRHRDPAFINRPGAGAVEPRMPPNDYYARCVARIEARSADGTPDEVFGEEVEATMPSRELEPGTNESVEGANGAAMLVTEAEAAPEEDFSRRPGETVHEYRERMEERIRRRPPPRSGPQGLADKVNELNAIEDAIRTDPDFHAWAQNLDPELYRNPTSVPGVQHNPVLSQTATGSPETMRAHLENADPWSFAGADGQAYSGDAHSVVRESSGIHATLYALERRRTRWLEALDALPEDTYGLSEAVRDIQTSQDMRDRMNKARRMGTLIRGGTHLDGSPIRPDGPEIAMPNVLDMF